MSRLTYNNITYTCPENESVLDVLHAHAVPVPSSCRSGLCQTCLMQAVKGTPPEAAQKGLKDTLRTQNYFLACSCHPGEDLEVTLPNTDTARVKATVNSIEKLCDDIVGVTLHCEQPLDYKAGQFINLFKDNALARSYSLASVPAQDTHLTLHVRKVPDGRMSGWIHHELNSGDSVEISLPVGDCFYASGKPEQAMLLIGTGSGLAPLYGIARDALAQGHSGPIKLYHGSTSLDGLYLMQELRQLAEKHQNFSYVPCVSDEQTESENITQGHVLDVALSDHAKLTGWRVFLCGNPNMVKAARKKTFLTGASMKDIYSDAFIPAS
jgi:NAD(P)H-flavin reductase/ferredoxin